jgi:hypothetical protein
MNRKGESESSILCQKKYVTVDITRIICNMMYRDTFFDHPLQGCIKKLHKWFTFPGLHLYTEGSSLVYQGFSVCNTLFTHYYTPTHQIHEGG